MSDFNDASAPIGALRNDAMTKNDTEARAANANDNDDAAEPRKPLSPAARRALAEAEERRRQTKAGETAPREIGGRGGLDPARFGDWEIKGRAIDF